MNNTVVILMEMMTLSLEKNGIIIDIFGKVGEDPGSFWTDDHLIQVITMYN